MRFLINTAILAIERACFFRSASSDHPPRHARVERFERLRDDPDSSVPRELGLAHRALDHARQSQQHLERDLGSIRAPSRA